jgi:hypothetical protein
VALLGLLLAGHRSSAQAVSAATGSSLYQTNDLYSDGTFRNAGTYTPTSGTLLVEGGDFLSPGPISSGGTGTVKLLEIAPGTGHTLDTGGQALPNLTLDVPAGTTLGSDASVSGSLDLLNGHLLTTSAYVLSLGSAATLTGETSAHYVKGRVAQAKAVSGTSPVDFGGLGVTVNPAGNSLTLTVQRRAGQLAAGTSYGTNPAMPTSQGIDRIWQLSSATAVSSPVTLTLAWLSDNDHGLTFTGTNAQVWRSDNNGSTWVRQGTVQNGSSRQVTVTTTALNALYTVSSTAAPLPVELAAFTAQLHGPAVALNWRTASEKDNAYFDVERSLTGKEFAAIARVPGQGTTTSPTDYARLDDKLPAGATTLYYRLRQVDRTGTATYSPVQAVQLSTQAATFAVYPTLVEAGRLHYAFTGPLPAEAVLRVYGATGQLLREVAVAAEGAGELSVAGLPSGWYVARLQTAAGSYQSRFQQP